MKKLFLITIFILISSSLIFAQEVLVGDDYKQDATIITEELRKLDIDEQIKSDDKLDLHDRKIENLATPTATTDAATKAYTDTKAAKGANSDITSLSGLTTPLSTPQGGSGVAGKTYATGTYTGTTADQNIAHGLGGTPTYIVITCFDDLNVPVFWMNGMETTMVDFSGGRRTNQFTAVPDGTNIKLKGAATYVNRNGITYYYVAIVGQ